MKKDVYQVVTDRIIQLLEAGTIPWHKPWKGVDEAPRNYVSRKAYRGINLFLLNAAGFGSPLWLTYRQIQGLEGRVKKGEKSWPVVFWKILEAEENGETKKVPFLRFHSVFNIAQCEGIPIPESLKLKADFEPIQKCEETITQMPCRPQIEHGKSRACYSPLLDVIGMPERGLFESSHAYYGTLFHELTHATGHASRVGRKEVMVPTSFGTDPCAREELVAEMGAAFLSGHCEIENSTLSQSAGYIENWLGRLKNDRKLVIQAAAQAQKACDFILNVKTDEEVSTEYGPKEFKVVALRECPTPEEMQFCDTPTQAIQYWRLHVQSHPHFNPDCECFVVLLLNTRKRIKGHQLVSIGTIDTLLVHPREVFRAAIVAAAASVVLMHNHPSGEPTPSDSDLRVTRELIRSGQLLRIEVCDHVVVGNGRHCSLRELGYFTAF